MSWNGYLQIGVYLATLLLLVKPLGWYMARVYDHQPVGLDRVLGPVERLLYRLAGVLPTQEMGWKSYAGAMLLFNALGFCCSMHCCVCKIGCRSIPCSCPPPPLIWPSIPR